MQKILEDVISGISFYESTAEQRTYFQARSSAGFNAEGLQNWQSQIAAQLIGHYLSLMFLCLTL